MLRMAPHNKEGSGLKFHSVKVRNVGIETMRDTKQHKGIITGVLGICKPTCFQNVT